MPHNREPKKILVIGRGPTVIGQGGELDFAAAQTCRALRNAGCEVITYTSDPASVTSTSEGGDKIYIEPHEMNSVRRVIEKERPDGIISTVGGQEALSLTYTLDKYGLLREAECAPLGVTSDFLDAARDPKLYRALMRKISVPIPKGGVASTVEKGLTILDRIGFPVFIKPACRINGTGSSIAYNREEFWQMLSAAMKNSPVRQALITESLIGSKEAEVEALMDREGNVGIFSVSENLDSVGIHTGDSVAVTPPQSLTPEQIETLRDMTVRIMKAVGEATGFNGLINLDFAVNRETGEIVLTELSPRAGITTAFVSRATGVPVCGIAALLNIGKTLDEAGFVEPEMKYCAVRVPEFAFASFPESGDDLSTSMLAVGESMAVDTDFPAALNKAYNFKSVSEDPETVREKVLAPNPNRLSYIKEAIRLGASYDIAKAARMDPFFIDVLRKMVVFEETVRGKSLVTLPPETLEEAKKLGYSDETLAALLETDRAQIRLRRRILGIRPKAVVCGAGTRFMTYNDAECEAPEEKTREKILLIGTGPNSIGVGSEFNLNCLHALMALRENDRESIIADPNACSAACDPGFSDKQYIVALNPENILEICDYEGVDGVIANFSGRRARKLIDALNASNIRILGTDPKIIRKLRDKKHVTEVFKSMGLRTAPSIAVRNLEDALAAAKRIGYPVLATSERTLPLGAEIIYDEGDIRKLERTITESGNRFACIISKFIEDAIRIGVDGVSDGTDTTICGIREHIEHTAVHAGDSACSVPTYSISAEKTEEIAETTRKVAAKLGIIGPLNVSYAITKDNLYILHLASWAARSLPFISRATGPDWAKEAVYVMLGKKAQPAVYTPRCFAVREAVMPFDKFKTADVILGPNMKSTGAAMGIDTTFGKAFLKSQIASGQNLPRGGTAFVSVADFDKPDLPEIGERLRKLGFSILATEGTARVLRDAGINAVTVSKIGEERPDATDLIKNGAIHLIINTLSGKKPRKHEVAIRGAVVEHGVPIITTIAGARATLIGMELNLSGAENVRSLDEYYAM